MCLTQSKVTQKALSSKETKTTAGRILHVDEAETASPETFSLVVLIK